MANASARQVYQPLLPGAIQRFAACDKTVQSLNKALQQQMSLGGEMTDARKIAEHMMQHGL